MRPLQLKARKEIIRTIALLCLLAATLFLAYGRNDADQTDSHLDKVLAESPDLAELRADRARKEHQLDLEASRGINGITLCAVGISRAQRAFVGAWDLSYVHGNAPEVVRDAMLPTFNCPVKTSEAAGTLTVTAGCMDRSDFYCAEPRRLVIGSSEQNRR